MLRHFQGLRTATALACILLTGSLLLPGTAGAETPRQPSSVRDAAKLIAERHAKSMKATRGAQGTASQPDLESGSFFKTPIGVAVLVAFVAGTGFAIYSSSNDRIKGSGR